MLEQIESETTNDVAVSKADKDTIGPLQKAALLLAENNAKAAIIVVETGRKARLDAVLALKKAA
jgi:hypothetical protein